MPEYCYADGFHPDPDATPTQTPDPEDVTLGYRSAGTLRRPRTAAHELPAGPPPYSASISTLSWAGYDILELHKDTNDLYSKQVLLFLYIAFTRLHTEGAAAIRFFTKRPKPKDGSEPTSEYIMNVELINREHQLLRRVDLIINGMLGCKELMVRNFSSMSDKAEPHVTPKKSAATKTYHRDSPSPEEEYHPVGPELTPPALPRIKNY